MSELKQKYDRIAKRDIQIRSLMEEQKQDLIEIGEIIWELDRKQGAEDGQRSTED